MSDIQDLNIGAAMPEILYGDDEKIIMHGSFGILTYNYKEEKITQRVHFEDIGEITSRFSGYRGAKDGRRIFILLYDEQKNYEYNLLSGKLNIFDGDIEDEAFSVPTLTDEENKQLTQAIGDTYLTSLYYLKKGRSILLLKAEAIWQMRTLQLVEYDNEARSV
ncbi:MAG: hypothetical protein K2G73_06930, partial [Eubacterium sp.]|nr:hypothetical protein [Eubacterium sp.]